MNVQRGWRQRGDVLAGTSIMCAFELSDMGGADRILNRSPNNTIRRKKQLSNKGWKEWHKFRFIRQIFCKSLLTSDLKDRTQINSVRGADAHFCTCDALIIAPQLAELRVLSQPSLSRDYFYFPSLYFLFCLLD